MLQIWVLYSFANMKDTLTTSGPVINRYDVSSTMKVKSVIAGEYTAPPAQGPMMREIWNMRTHEPHLFENGKSVKYLLILY
jgi:hypothetical protein